MKAPRLIEELQDPAFEGRVVQSFVWFMRDFPYSWNYFMEVRNNRSLERFQNVKSVKYKVFEFLHFVEYSGPSSFLCKSSQYGRKQASHSLFPYSLIVMVCEHYVLFI